MIAIAQKENRIGIYLTASIINSSADRADLVSLKRALVSQLEKTFRCSAGRYQLSLKADIEVLYRVRDCSPTKVLFQVVDSLPGNHPAEADFKGLRIQLNKAIINDIIYNRNVRTIPHELGHLFGWDHPHAPAKYESVNIEAHPLEQQMTEEERKHNLMSQGWYPQRTNILLDQAMHISEKQVDLLLLHYRSGQLNRNLHLKHFLFWKKLLA
jgi:hypothetical protein